MGKNRLSFDTPASKLVICGIYFSLFQGETITTSEATNTTEEKQEKTFRWAYVVLPAVLLLLSIATAVAYYHLLPPQTAYHFSDGIADRWMGRGAIISWLLLPQFLLALIGITLSAVGASVTRKYGLDNRQVRRILTIMGNMVALPQIILYIIMLNIFLYNAYGTTPLPLLPVVLAVLIPGTFILGGFFIFTIMQVRTTNRQ